MSIRELNAEDKAATHPFRPKRCKRFSKRIPLSEKSLKHLPDCDACKAVICICSGSRNSTCFDANSEIRVGRGTKGVLPEEHVAEVKSVEH